ncbi:MAG: HIT family protein [Planctomycetota bacterium]|jgi:diadenosine tetraphosphate (Ap4A) HIT family hydrolase
MGKCAEILNSPNDCEACKISQRKENRDVIKLDGNWTLNHYSGPEGYLGWLILQPYRHVAHFQELNDNESSTLGHNLKLIDTVLRAYWTEHFPEDPIERLYLVCFSESLPKHFHFHLIPRTRQLGNLFKDEDCTVGWDIYKISKKPSFPKEYVVHWNYPNDNEAPSKVKNFMTGLRKKIQEMSKNNK